MHLHRDKFKTATYLGFEFWNFLWIPSPGILLVSKSSRFEKVLDFYLILIYFPENFIASRNVECYKRHVLK